MEFLSLTLGDETRRVGNTNSYYIYVVILPIFVLPILNDTDLSRRVDVSQLRFALDITLPHLYIEGQYEIDGRVLLLPIRGNGPMTGNFTMATGSVKIQAGLFKDDQGHDHLKLNEFRMRISIRKGSLKLENLFGGDPTLGNVVNNAINSNFDAFIKELQPLIEKALSSAFTDIGNNIVRPFTYEQLFPMS